MLIKEVYVEDNGLLRIINQNNIIGFFDIKPYLKYEAFNPLKKQEEFAKIHNGGYFIEWECGADLSADTIEAKWTQQNNSKNDYVYQYTSLNNLALILKYGTIRFTRSDLLNDPHEKNHSDTNLCSYISC